MNRQQLAHVLRAAARIVEDGDVVVVGSQAILGTYDAPQLPPEVTMSVEADLAFRDDPDELKADTVDGAIGEASAFHETFGYYAQGVTVATAVLPAGWEDRVVPFERDDAQPSTAVCLEPHDLVVAKLVAGREKDVAFASSLIQAHLVDVEVLRRRAGEIEAPAAVRRRVLGLIEQCSRPPSRRLPDV